MIKRVFVDSDIVLDVALAREPFLEASRLVLAVMENGKSLGYLSSNSITNIYYILRKAGGDLKARAFIVSIMKYMTVIPVDQNIILSALNSKFSDFEDAVQYNSALESQCSCIVTRNIEDYKLSKLNVYLPIEFLNLFE